METKNELVRKLVSRGEYKAALQICKDWQYKNPDHRDILRLGYECLLYPSFYEQLGKDPSHHYEESIRVLLEVYGDSL